MNIFNSDKIEKDYYLVNKIFTKLTFAVNPEIVKVEIDPESFNNALENRQKTFSPSSRVMVNICFDFNKFDYSNGAKVMEQMSSNLLKNLDYATNFVLMGDKQYEDIPNFVISPFKMNKKSFCKGVVDYTEND